MNTGRINAVGTTESAGEIIGQSVPTIHFVDDFGRGRNLSELSGSPTILIPIYTACHGSCPIMTNSLKSAILQSSVPTGTYHVVLFSFDPRDDAQNLHHFREHEHLPFQWTMAASASQDSESLMKSIGFRYTSANGEFIHPNLAAILDSRLRVTRIISGENYTTSEIEQALNLANGHHDWRETLELPAFCIGLLILTLSAGYFIHLVTRRMMS